MRPSETDRLYLEEITASRYPVAMDDQPPLRIDITGVGEEPTAPEEVKPELVAPVVAPESPSMTAYDPTVRERLAEFLQAGFESFGMERFQARRQAQSLVGGPSSNLPLQLGVADIVPFLGTGLQTEEAGRMLEDAADFAQRGEYGEAAISAAVGALGLVPGAAGTVKAARQVGELANVAGDKAVQAITGNPQATSTAVLEAAGQMSPLANIMPKVTAKSDTVVPVKVGQRQVELPVNQAAVLSKAVKNLTPAEQAKFKANTAKTFVENLTALPSKQEFGAAALAGSAKKGWYEGSTQAIVNVFGPDASRFAALLSATSPQTSVESNLYNALQIWKNWTAAGRPVDRDSIVRVMGESVQGGKGEESVLDAWINNSVRALSAEDPSSVMLSGPKVDSFMRNLQGNVNEVTNDAWMASFALVDQKIFSGSLTKTDPGKGPGYLAMNARVRETADYLTNLTGEAWTPAEVQETIWSWAKTLYETAGSAGETRSAVQLIRDDAITNELIASTPDFRTLFYDQRFQPILEQAGYGDQLAKLRAATAGADGSAGSKKPRASGKAGAIDPEAQRKLNERNAKRLDKLRKQREEASAQKSAAQTPPGGNK
jgi:hypothetical protein